MFDLPKPRVVPRVVPALVALFLVSAGCSFESETTEFSVSLGGADCTDVVDRYDEIRAASEPVDDDEVEQVVSDMVDCTGPEIAGAVMANSELFDLPYPEGTAACVGDNVSDPEALLRAMVFLARDEPIPAGVDQVWVETFQECTPGSLFGEGLMGRRDLTLREAEVACLDQAYEGGALRPYFERSARNDWHIESGWTNDEEAMVFGPIYGCVDVTAIVLTGRREASDGLSRSSRDCVGDVLRTAGFLAGRELAPEAREAIFDCMSPSEIEFIDSFG